jgi:Protein of unknown function (DUF2971)
MSNSLYHYCSLDSFLKIVQSKEIWHTNIFCMNDSAEHFWLRRIAKAMVDRDPDSANSVNKFLAERLFSKEDQTDVYCFCLTESGDSLDQWRGYADDGRGVAIGFSLEFLRAVHKAYHLSGLRFKSVIYDQQRQESIVKHLLDNAKKRVVDTSKSSAPAEWIEQLPFWIAESGIWSWAAQCKNPFFSDEKEWRLIYDASKDNASSLGQPKYRSCGDTIVPYYALPLEPLPEMGQLPVIEEVVLGPKCNQEFNEPMVKSILSGCGYNVNFLNVRRSSGTYR